MSTFQVNARRIRAIEPHTNADALEFAVIDDYRSIVRKGTHKAGDLVVYIPEGAVLPEGVLKSLGLWDDTQNKGKCAGERGNRVKAMMLRSKLSQGVVYPLSWMPDWQPGVKEANNKDGNWHLHTPEGKVFRLTEGTAVEELLGVTKFKPVIPAELQGQCFDGGVENLPRFDIENVKTYPEGVLVEGEEVAFHEKLHGTFTGFMLLPEDRAIPGFGRVLVFSKGTAADAMAFKVLPEAEGNVYIKAFHRFGIEDRLHKLAGMLSSRGRATGQPVFIFGEVLGSASRQDLKYGTAMDFRVFDLGFGGRSERTHLDDAEVDEYLAAMGMQRVPLLYRGPFSKELLTQHTQGKETYSGKGLHIREGVVVRPAKERGHDAIGRVILKSVSPQYLVRSGEATEYQ